MGNAEKLITALGPAFESGDMHMDPERIDAWTEALRPLAAPGFTAMMAAQGGVDREFDDVDGLRDGWRDWIGAFSRMTFVIEAVEPVGPHVITIARQIATTRHGVDVEQPSAAVWKFDENGRIYRVEFHLDREMALESARAA